MIPLPVLPLPPLLQFRAGRARLANGVVTASATKGYVSLLRGGESSVELIWSGEGGEQVSLTLPRGKTTAQYTDKCTTGRMLVLTVSDGGAGEASSRTHFFWLQDKSTAKDVEHLTRLQELLAPRTTGGGAGGRGGGAGGASGGMVRLEDVKRMLADISASSASDAVELVDVLASNKITAALREHADFFATRLRPLLPPDTPSDADLVSEVKCSQVTNAARVLQHALRDPATFRALCREFALDPPSDAQTSGVAAFLKRVADKGRRGGRGGGARGARSA